LLDVALRPPVTSRDRRATFVPVARSLLLGLVAALVGMVVVVPAAFAADPAGPTSLSSKVTFYGRGYGHGVGMSQYGARGRALDGQDATTILEHYYRGTRPAELATSSEIRVLVLDRYVASSAHPLSITGRVTDWSIDGIDGTFPADARLAVLPRFVTGGAVTKTTWWIKVISPTGESLLSRAAPATRFALRGIDDTSRFEVTSKPGSRDLYRGSVRVVTTQTGGQVSVVDTLPMEDYLRGVVPAEMPSTWPTEALRAQAIASRSYAVRKLRPGVSYFDIYDDTRAQVYQGVRVEKASSDAAIADTADVVLWSGNSVANTLYHSTGGGANEDNEKAFVSATGKRLAAPVSYLRGSSDRRDDGTSYDAGAPYSTWATKTYGRSTLSAWFAADPRTNVGTLTAIDLRDRGVSGRLISVVLIGSKGTKRVSGDVFRAVFNAARPSGDPSLRSTLFDTSPIR